MYEIPVSRVNINLHANGLTSRGMKKGGMRERDGELEREYVRRFFVWPIRPFFVKKKPTTICSAYLSQTIITCAFIAAKNLGTFEIFGNRKDYEFDEEEELFRRWIKRLKVVFVENMENIFFNEL